MYATWNLNWEDPNYGTGPEPEIALLGSKAAGIISDADVTTGTILGRIDSGVDISRLEKWSVKLLTDEEALEFAKGVAPGVTLDDEGNLVFPEINFPDMNTEE